MYPFSKHFAITCCILLSCPASTLMADDAANPAQAAYPRPFSRPPSMGVDYDTWRGAKGPDIGIATVKTYGTVHRKEAAHGRTVMKSGARRWITASPDTATPQPSPSRRSTKRAAGSSTATNP